MIVLHDIFAMCRNHPQLLIFFALAIGYYVGKINFFGFKLGSTAGVLLASLVLGQIDVVITPLIKTVAFTLFIFTIGYKVGPEFFGSLKKEGFNYIIISLFMAVVGLVTAIILGRFFAFDAGTTAGMFAGAMTQSSVLGTAEEAIRRLSISVAQQDILSSDMAVAYAITYIFGVAGLVLFYKIVPKILKIDLKSDAKKIDAALAPKTNSTNLDHVKVTNIVMLGLGCFLGSLLGLIVVHVGDISLTLGMGGGVLLVGLLFGWLQTMHPSFGIIPEASQWLLTSLGLNIFIACVGITAGPKAIHALQTQGPSLFFAGVALTLIPHILTLIFGMLFLKLDPVLLLGALTGAGTVTPALNVLKDEADSAAPAIGYTIPYAIGNFVLTIWGTVIINFMK